eukprot:15265162-Ditylum_brightwellii.AAC.1
MLNFHNDVGLICWDLDIFKVQQSLVRLKCLLHLHCLNFSSALWRCLVESGAIDIKTVFSGIKNFAKP